MVSEKRPSILLIEDDDELGIILAELIEGWGYQVVTAQSLPSALIKVNNQKFNVVILDLALRKTSGLKLLETIRRNPTSMNHTTPIVLHSGHIETDIFAKYRGDIDDALVKPSPSELIRDKLAFWAEKKHTSATSKFAFMHEFLSRKAA